MKLEKLMTKKCNCCNNLKEDKFTELVRITNFSSVEESIKRIQEHFNCEFYWTHNKNNKKFKYAYLTGDCQVYFVKELKEFNFSKTEKDWKVDYSIEF
jgi:hypothetical protein